MRIIFALITPLRENMWASLPTDLLQVISAKLPSWTDHCRFRSVCTSWRSAATPKRPHLPLLLVKFSTSDLTSFWVRLCNFPNMVFYRLPKMPDGPSEKISKNTCGSSRGWLGFLDYQSKHFSLHNPFTGVQVSLPNLHSCYKFVLSCDPAAESNDCVVMAYYPSHLQFCRLGDTSWTPVIYSGFPEGPFIGDFTFYNGNFYVASIHYGLFLCNVDPCDTSVTEISPAIPLFSDSPTQQWHQPSEIYLDGDEDGENIEIYGYKFYNGGTKKYLVVSSGELWLVAITHNHHFTSTDCQVFRIDIDGGQLKLFKLENLGGHSIFLDRESSVSLQIGDTPPTWCKKNCIYHVGAESRIVVFNLQDHNISYMTDYLKDQLAMHWFTAALC